MTNEKARKAEAEQPEAEQAEDERAGADQPGTDQPATDQPATDQLATDQAGTEPPGTEPAGAERAGAKASAAGAGAAAEQRSGDAAEPDVVAQLESQVAENKERMLRAMAELENVRRRAERERKEAEAYGGTRLARDLLPVYDNLERALAHADDTARQQAGGVIEGIELTRRELLSAFAKHRIEMFTPEKGEKFDPHLQQAMFEAPVPGAAPGTVIETVQSGFTIAGRLLRPALVGVAKAAPEETEPKAGGREGDREGDGDGDGEGDLAKGEGDAGEVGREDDRKDDGSA